MMFDTEASTARPSRRWITRRRLLLVGAVLAAIVTLAVAVAHTPPVRSAVLRRAIAALEDTGVRASVAELDYNLLSLNIAARGVSLTAEESDVPFFTADAIRIDLPWSILGGALAVESLEADSPSVTIVRMPDGTFNLPAGSDEPSEPMEGPIEIGRLDVRNLSLRYDDRMDNILVDGRDIDLTANAPAGSPLEGRLAAEAPISIRVDKQETRISRLAGGLSFDGRALALADLSIEAPEGGLRLDGTIRVLPEVELDGLAYDGRLDLARLAPWVGVEPEPAGGLSFSGSASGPIDSLTATIEVASHELQWSGLDDLSISTRARYADAALTIDSLRARIAGGEMSGTARVGLEENAPGRARLTWQDVALGPLVQSLADPSMRLASDARGSVSLDWTGTNVLAGHGTIENVLRAPASTGGALPLSGRARLELTDGHWQLSHEHTIEGAAALNGSAGGRIDPDTLTASTLSGRASLDITSLARTVQAAGSAGLAGTSGLSELQGAVSLNTTLTGTLGEPRAAGALEASGVRYGDTGPGTLAGRFSAGTDRLVLDPLDITVGANQVTGRTTIEFETGALRGELRGDLPQLASLTTELPAEYRPVGSATFDARLAGTLDNPTVNGELVSTDLEVAGQSVQQLRSTFRLADQIITIEQFDLTQAGGQLAATARYALDSGRFAADVSGTGLTIAASEDAELPLDARFDIKLAGSGTLEAPVAQGFVDFSRLAWDGYEIGTARVDLEAADRAVQVKGRMPEVAATLQARASLEGPRSFTADVSIDEANLARLARPSGPAGTLAPEDEAFFDRAALVGSVSMRVLAEGQLDELAEATASLDLRLNGVTVNGVPVRLARPARLGYSNEAVVASDFDLRVGGMALTARGRLAEAPLSGDALSISLTGPIADLVPLVRIAPDLEAFDASGALDLKARATGSLTSPQLDATVALDGGSFGTGDLPPVTDVILDAVYENGVLDLRTLAAMWQGARVSGTAQAPAAVLGDSLPAWYAEGLPAASGPAKGILRIESITPEALAPFVEGDALAEIDGRIDAVVAVTAPSIELDDIEADVTLERAEFALARIPLSQSRPTRLRLADGRLKIVDWTWAGGGNRINLSGGAEVAGESPALDLAVDGTLDLRMLSAFAPDIASSGRAALDVRVTGPTDAPLVDGQLSVENGALVLRDPRFAISDLKGTVSFAKDELRLGTITANANGGTLSVTGNIQYPKLELTGGTVAIAGRGLAFELPDDLRSEVDADLQLNLAAPSLTGTITVLRGSYREPVSLAGQLLTGVETRPAEPPSDAEPGFADRVVLDIAVKTAEDLVVDNNYARLEASGDLRIVGTIAAPVPTGRLTIREGGDVFLGGRTYEIARGTVDFTSATELEPNIDLALETRVQRYDITLEVSGTPATIEANLRSPGLSQADVVSLLLTGEVAEAGAIAQPEIARGQLLMLLSGELLSFAGRAVGLDTVQVGRGLGGAASDFDLLATDTDPSARLTVSKNLRNDVELVFSQSLRDTGDITWIAIYRPLGNVEVRGATQDDGSRSVEFRHEVNFGGGGDGGAGPRAARAPRSVEEVTAVRITGTPGLAEAEIRDALRLQPGDEFDFYRWQQDRDRLQELYRRRNFLEAHTSARRHPDGTTGNRAGVALEYEIEQGPETVLTIDGHSLPGSVRERMIEAWMFAVYDGFLLDDLSSIARDHLLAEGYLAAAVESQVVTEPDQPVKEIAVRIEPGTRFTDRRIEFSGQQALSADTLESAVAALESNGSMWRNPSALRSAIESLYRSRGYLAVEVAVREPVFTGTAARLPVFITEGPQFTIASIDIEGTASRAEAAIRKVFGLDAGAPYRRDALEPARRAVEIDYLREGYNEVRVALTSLVDQERSQVDLVLNIEEGPQQVLADITVSGARITRASVVDRALDVEIGQPANRSEFFRAEKRLYDTGAFRLADIALVPLAPGAAGRVEQVRAEVTLEEIDPYRFRYGFRVNDAITPTEADRDIRPALVVDLLRRNLFGRAIAAGAAGQLEPNRRLARGIISLPRFFGLPVTTNFFATTSHEEFTPESATPFFEDQSGFTLEQRFTVTPRMGVTYGYTLSRTHIFESEADAVFGIPPLDLRARIARLTGTYAWDRRDDPFAPRDGWFHSSGFEGGAKTLGSDLRFMRYLAQQQYYRTFGGSVVVASAFRLGLGRGFDQDLIPSEKFFAGGGTSVRGFAEDGLGPVDFFGDPRGGNSMAILNQEVRFPIYRWVRGVAFVDGGNVFPTIRDFSLAALEAGTGAGLRIDSPFALIRIDLAVPLTSRRREPSHRWYFGIGQAF